MCQRRGKYSKLNERLSKVKAADVYLVPALVFARKGFASQPSEKKTKTWLFIIAVNGKSTALLNVELGIRHENIELQTQQDEFDGEGSNEVNLTIWDGVVQLSFMAV